MQSWLSVAWKLLCSEAIRASFGPTLMTVYVQAAWEKQCSWELMSASSACSDANRQMEEERVSVLIPQVCSRVSSCPGQGSWTERMRGDCGQIDTREAVITNQVSPGHLRTRVCTRPLALHTPWAATQGRLQEGREEAVKTLCPRTWLLGAWLSPQPAQTLAWTI